jgi:hypothetical protein
MDTIRKTELLQTLLRKSNEISGQSSSNPKFKSWRNLVESTFVKIFGENSIEVKQLNELQFTYKGARIGGTNYERAEIRAYSKSFEALIQTIVNYIEEFREDFKLQNSSISQDEFLKTETTKIFISHSSLDKKMVEELIELLELIGLKSAQIFCSSFEGYGIEFGENFLERIKEELNSNVLVLFILSNNFYASPVSLCEMGATWIKTNKHIPILIPPFEFDDIKGVIPFTHGFKINNTQGINQFKTQIEGFFNLSELKNDPSHWERKRNKIIERMNIQIQTAYNSAHQKSQT